MRCIKMPNIQNLVPNARASISFPLGMTYQKLYFALGSTGLTKSMISNIVLKVNNKEFQRWNSAADLDIFNAYKGNNTSAPTYLIFDFTERLARTEVGLTLGTIAACQEAGVQAFTLEFDIGAWTVGGGTSPAMFADVDAPSANRVIQRVQMQQKALSAAVQDTFYIPFGAQGYQLARVLMKMSNVSAVKVRRDGVDVFEDLPAGLMNARAADFGRNPQTGWVHLRFHARHAEFERAEYRVHGSRQYPGGGAEPGRAGDDHGGRHHHDLLAGLRAQLATVMRGGAVAAPPASLSKGSHVARRQFQ